MIRTFVLGPTNALALLVTLAMLGVKVFALVDAAIRPQPAWRAVVNQTKAFWLLVLGVSVVLGGFGLFGGIGLLSIVTLVAAIYYLVDVRSRLLEVRGRRASRW